MFVIHWRSLITGKTGHGTKAFHYWEAKRYCDRMNRDDRGLLWHWLVQVN